LPALSAAEERIPLPRAAVDREPLLELRRIEPARLREERDRVLPDERLDRRLGEAAGAKIHHRTRHLERIAPSPVGRAVDDHALDAVALEDRAHALLGHLRIGI